jgi:two-component system sensor histidine kinase ChiS
MSARRLYAFVFGIAMLMVLAAGAARARTAMIDLSNESVSYPLLGTADVLADPNGSLDIDDVAGSTGFHSSTVDSQPPSGGVQWYRFQYATSEHSEGRWYLTAEYCDEADLYVRRAGSGDGYVQLRFGESVPFARHPAPGVWTGLALPPTTGHESFLRLRCPGWLQEPILQSRSTLLANPRSFNRHALELVLSLMSVLSLGLALVSREKMFLIAGAPGFATLLEFVGMDLPRTFPSLAAPPIATVQIVCTILTILATWYFFYAFFNLRRVDRAIGYAIGFFAGCGIAGDLLLYYVLPVGLKYSWYGMLVTELIPNALMLLAALLATIAAIRKGNREAWFVGAAIVVQLASDAVQNASGDFISSLQYLLTYAAGATTMFLFILAIGDRLTLTVRANEEAMEQRDESQAALMAAESENLADVERYNVSFARFVPRALLGRLGKADVADVELGDNVETDLAVLFSSIHGFSALAERMAPAEIFDFVNAYFARIGPIVRKHGGFVGSYISDSIIALFPGKPSDAVDAAIELTSEVRRINEERARKGYAALEAGVGIHYGSCMLGTIGEPQRMETTVIADTVNTASRLEDVTGAYGASIIVSESLAAALDDRTAYCLRPLGDISLRGQERVEQIREIFDGDSYDVVLHKQDTLATFDLALEAYRTGRYAASRDLFADVARLEARDVAAAYLRDRSSALLNAASPMASTEER